MNIFKIVKKNLSLFDPTPTIKKQVKKDKNIIYGANALRHQMGFFARNTSDYDIFTKTPRKSAVKLQRKLDQQVGEDLYYNKPALHPGTHKVYYKGQDKRKGTDDDVHLVDFSKPDRKHKIVIINGIRYVKIEETLKDKRKSLRDKTQQFRWKKDQEDVDRIRTYKRLMKR